MHPIYHFLHNVFLSSFLKDAEWITWNHSPVTIGNISCMLLYKYSFDTTEIRLDLVKNYNAKIQIICLPFYMESFIGVQNFFKGHSILTIWPVQMMLMLHHQIKIQDSWHYRAIKNNKVGTLSQILIVDARTVYSNNRSLTHNRVAA